MRSQSLSLETRSRHWHGSPGRQTPGSARTVSSACPQCDSDRRTKAECFHDPDESGPYGVVTCCDCGLMYTHPRPAPEDWDRFYPASYPPHQPSRKRRRWHTRLRLRVAAACAALCQDDPAASIPWPRTAWRLLLGRMVDPRVPARRPGSRLLDLGCGAGEYLETMRSLGWTVVGVEPSPRAAQAARSRGVPVLLGVVPHPDLPLGSFDVVTAWQVLEHVESPRATLAAVRDLMRPGAQLFLTVPNQDGWAARHFGPHWIGLDLPRHLTHFTPHTLAHMLQDEGFALRRLETWSSSSWIRHSARRTLFTSKALSRRASQLATCSGQGEIIYARARLAP